MQRKTGERIFAEVQTLRTEVTAAELEALMCSILDKALPGSPRRNSNRCWRLAVRFRIESQRPITYDSSDFSFTDHDQEPQLFAHFVVPILGLGKIVYQVT